MINVPLITRFCLCGCGKSFRIWPETSPQMFASEACAYFALFKTDEEIKAVAKKYFARHGDRFRWKRLRKKIGVPYEPHFNYDMISY